MKAFFLRLALATTIMVPVTSALAADLDAPPPVEDLRPATYDWTGVYAGVVGSVVSLEGHYNKHEDCVDTGTCGEVDPEMSGTGYAGGIIAGVNWSIDDFLIGVEGDYSWATNIGHNHEPAELTEMNFNGIATLRGRAGVILDNTLLYATGGVAFLDTEFTGQMGGGCGCDYTAKDTAWVTGWAIGAGLEHAFTDNFHGRLEYLYIDAPNQNYRIEDPNGYGGNVDMHFNGIHTIRAGLTYNFTL